jgi:glycosyltransferase involved in cell wall biosynthesis
MVPESEWLLVMRVGFTLFGGSHWTGGRNYLLNLFRVLREHQRVGVEPVLFVADDASAKDLDPFRSLLGKDLISAHCMTSGQSAARSIGAIFGGRASAVAKEFSSHGVDVVFEAAGFYGWRFPLPCLTWIPDFQHRHLPHMFSTGYWWRRDIGYRIQVGAGRTIMLSSEDARRDCEAFYPTTRGRTVVVPFAVPPPSISQGAPAESMRRHELPHDFLFMPNQFWKHKNHAVVIEALALLGERGRSIVVAASGNPADVRHVQHFDQLRERVRSHGLEAQFRFLGMLPYAEVLALMAGCRALINPSLFEGWSTTVEEAKALGAPLVLSDLTVHREQAGESAVYFDPSSAASTAEAMLEAKRRFGNGNHTERAHMAAVVADANVDRYAARFADAVQLAARRFGGATR